MTEATGKKGMSKGCLVALIVGLAVLLIVIILGVTCYLKKDDLVKYGVTTVVNSIRAEIIQNPAPGVDTTVVNSVTDAFLKELEASEPDFEQLGQFGQGIQSIMEDKAVDSAETDEFLQALVDYYPSLEHLIPEPEALEPPLDEELMPDSTATASFISGVPTEK